MDLNLSKNTAKFFSKRLIGWYNNNKRDLPWRKTKDPYKIWLSEIILQQTKIVQGLPYYLKFENKYPNVFELANANEEEILKLWEGLGYYSRARNLHKTSKIVINKLNGIFPTNYSDLIKLPGIGDYTASAISSFSINEINPVIDGNVYRFLSRYFGIKTAVNTNKSLKEFKNIAKLLISKKYPSEFNQAIMEFGALMCKPTNPNCETCLFKTNCFAYLGKEISNFPVKKLKKKIKDRFFNFLIFKSTNNQTLIEKREKKDIWQNLYQFPLIETDKNACHNTILNQLYEREHPDCADIKIELFNNKVYKHKLSHQNIYSCFWLINVNKITKNQVKIFDLNLYPFPKPISNFISVYNW